MDEAAAVLNGVALAETPRSGAVRARVPALRVQGLSKKFTTVAVDNRHRLHVRPGDVAGIVKELGE